VQYAYWECVPRCRPRPSVNLVTSRRPIVGIAGAPAAGKSTFAQAYVDQAGASAALVPLDGFHLADAMLSQLGWLDRKGAPETFDAWGYAALLRRLRERPDETVYAPGFERNLEQPIAGSIAVPYGVDIVVTEGNYLLLDRPEWRAVREQLEEVWFVFVDEAARLERLVARHVAFGKSPEEARIWVARVDEPNATLVEESRSRADRIIDLSGWDGRGPVPQPQA
jgi:pantothenate kinase